MVDETGVYRRLAEKLNYAPSSALFQGLLRQMLTPEDVRLMLALPASLEGLAEDLGQTPQTLEARLQELVTKGLVVRRRRGYTLPQNVPHLHDGVLTSSQVDPGVCDLWRELRQAEAQTWVNWLTERETIQFRVIPAWRALETVAPEEVLPWEDVRGIIDRAGLICLINCPCRMAMRRCDTPVETCLQFGRSAEYLLQTRGTGREITVTEALALVAQSMERGLVHIALNIASDPPSLCSCCADCCAIIEHLSTQGAMARGLAKSRYQAVVDHELCTGCQICVERCLFDAVEMKKSPPAKRLKAAVDAEKCYGCGECVVKCDVAAIVLKAVRPPEYILEPGKASLY